ncbi:hypothetical protein [Paramesorhizobium deserti]|uniref:hypothetical protein n=1 Tax=Paramesorhizobium deserti TaxID=1494590 RepID=UPI001910C6C7|nr:hypothetical protein [Paramesorhizobium deserti]
MNLNAPTRIVFFISVIIAVLSLISFFGALAFIPVAAYWILAIAYLVLVAGCVLKNI